MKESTYQDSKNKSYTLKIREVQKELPEFCGEYFRSLSNMNMSVLTRYGYAVDLRGFFRFLTEEVPLFSGTTPLSFTIDDLKKVTSNHIDLYLEYVSVYEKNDQEISNGENGRARKLAAVRSFFKYYFKHQYLDSNVAALVESPKLHEHAIIRLEPNEVAVLLDQAESGANLTDKQRQFHKNTQLRDITILTLFLGTGIRISELVGINVNDIDFDNYAFTITRKGGKQDILSFGEEVADALRDYADQRKNMSPIEGHENAFFLSLQNRRITVRAVENLVKKYASSAVPLKKITPHKLRSTYGTMLYQESQDIYLVADVLGHKDVNTTRKHYAAQSRDNKRAAARMIHLRDD